MIDIKVEGEFPDAEKFVLESIKRTWIEKADHISMYGSKRIFHRKRSHSKKTFSYSVKKKLKSLKTAKRLLPPCQLHQQPKQLKRNQ